MLESREGHLNVPQHGGGQHLVRQGKHVGLGLQTSSSYAAALPSPDPPFPRTVSSHFNHLPKAPPPKPSTYEFGN